MAQYRKIKQWVIFCLAILVLFTASMLLNTISDNSNAGPAFFIFVLSLITGFLILKRSINLINVFFTTSTFLISLSSLIALIAYINVNYEWLFGIASAILIISPLGMYISTKIILDGYESWKEFEIFLLTGFAFFLAVVFLILKERLNYSQEILISDSFLIILFLLIIYQLIRIEYRIHGLSRYIRLLISGYLISIAGFLGNLVFIFLSQNDKTFVQIRIILPAIGMVFVTFVFSFIDSDEVVIQKKDYKDISKFVRYVHEAVLNLTANFELSKKNKSLISLDQLPFSNQEFQEILSDQVNGIALALLVEASLAYPKPILNSQMQVILNKRKPTISKHLHKLVRLGFLKEIVNLQDIRTRPYILTEKGSLYIFQLHSVLDTYISKEDNLYIIAASMYKQD